MPKIEVASIPERRGSRYPKPFDQIAKDRVRAFARARTGSW